jgi:hypothetical protein
MSCSGLRQDDSGGVFREHWRQRFGKHEACQIPLIYLTKLLR